MAKGIDRRAIRKLHQDIKKEFEKQNKRSPIAIPVQAEVDAQPPGIGGAFDANSEIGSHCVRMLDWLHRTQEERPGTYQQVYDYMRLIGLESFGGDPNNDLPGCPGWLLDVIATLEEAGLIECHSRGLGAGHRHDMLVLTSRGRRDVAERRERRSELRFRRLICRRNLLRWIYDSSVMNDSQAVSLEEFRGSLWGTVEGDPLTSDEVLEAKEYLEDQGFIVEGGLILSDKGISCVEDYGGQVSDYVAGQQAGGTSFVNHFHAAIGNMQMAQGNRDVQQNQTVDGLDTQALSVLARALEEAAPVLGANEATQAEVAQVAIQLREAVEEGEPNPERIRGILGWGKRILENTAGSALATVLLATITSML
ncbi:hypothetical protein [Thermomonospora amylolytica]|uniref:hypothetical protein n=1 Tax=Thermomonospora amylolytica TaxID=1411117 RepID=UPI00130046BF|nr:hypothetical protein [Thermomonospora amylolytica]